MYILRYNVNIKICHMCNKITEVTFHLVYILYDYASNNIGVSN